MHAIKTVVEDLIEERKYIIPCCFFLQNVFQAVRLIVNCNCYCIFSGKHIHWSVLGIWRLWGNSKWEKRCLIKKQISIHVHKESNDEVNPTRMYNLDNMGYYINRLTYVGLQSIKVTDRKIKAQIEISNFDVQ